MTMGRTRRTIVGPDFDMSDAFLLGPPSLLRKPIFFSLKKKKGDFSALFLYNKILRSNRNESACLACERYGDRYPASPLLAFYFLIFFF